MTYLLEGIISSPRKDFDPESLSKIGQSIFCRKDRILKEWEQRVRKLLPEAEELEHPILIDTLPALLDNLAQVLSLNESDAILDSSISQEHGGERARLTNFDLSAIIEEYRTLRSVIYFILRTEGILFEDHVKDKVDGFIDRAIQESATTFALINSGLREQVMATLGHDMRSRLTAATLSADYISKKATDPVLQVMAEKIKRSHRRIDGMIQDLLDTTLVRSGGQLSLRLQKLHTLPLLAELQQELAPDDVNLLKIDGCQFEAFWDKDLMRRALENLVANAFKYGEKGREVTLSLRNDNERAIFRVHNFGPVIPKEEQEVIFQVYRRAEAAQRGEHKGWGLGLPLARSVAESHGGSIVMESLIDKGTTFIIDIPIDSRPYETSTNKKMPKLRS